MGQAPVRSGHRSRGSVRAGAEKQLVSGGVWSQCPEGTEPLEAEGIQKLQGHCCDPGHSVLDFSKINFQLATSQHAK